MSKKHVTKVEFQGRDKTGAATRSFTGNLENANSAVTKALGKYGALAGAAAGVAAGIYKAARSAYEFVDRMADLGDEMDKLSARTGMAVEELSQYDYYVKRGGGSTGDMEAFIKRLSRSMADARDGVKESTDAFARLGITTDQLVNADGSLKEISEVMPLLADGFKQVNSQAERMDLAQAIGGRGGTMLLPALQNGRDGLAELEERLQTIGGTMSTDFASASAKFKDAQLDVSTAWKLLREDFALPFVIAGASDLEDLAEMLGGIRHGATGARAALSALGGPLGAIANLWGPRNGAGGSEGTLFGAFLDNYKGGAGSLIGDAVPNRPTVGSPLANNLGGVSGNAADWERMPWWRREQATDDISLFPVDGQDDLTRGIDVVMDRMAEFGDGVDETAGKWSDMGYLVAGSVADNMTAAFDRVLWYGQDVADALAEMFKDTFSSILSGLFRVAVGAGLNRISPGLGTALGFPTWGKRAGGGPVTGGKPYMVGENGPELYVPQSSGSIVPNHAMGGSRTFNVNITAQDMSDPMHLRRLAKKLIQAIEDEEGYYYAGASA